MNAQKELILNYLGQRSTMILCTYGAEGPWATPIFYVNCGYKLYFLSELTTRHSQNLLHTPTAAAAITEDHSEWQTIQGIQLQGRAYLVSGTIEIAASLAAYCTKFPAVRQIVLNPGLFKGVAAARWHCLLPETLRFTDNTRSFGERAELCFNVVRTAQGFDFAP